MARPAKTEGDGHPISWKWGKPGFDSVDPKQFFMGVCGKCGFAGELEDADFRTAGKDPEHFKRTLIDSGVQLMVAGVTTGKGAAQSLLKRISPTDPFGSAIAKFHLGIFSQCLRMRITVGTIARYYLRLAWLYRESATYYEGTDVAAFAEGLAKVGSRWRKELPDHSEYPASPGLALDEVQALKFSRAYFQRNYETLKEAKLEEELRLRLLLAEIGFRLYELTDDDVDYKKAASFFSGAMQKCLSIISDKSIVGGVVNRAREVLEVSGERGRELRALNKSRGGSGAEADDSRQQVSGAKKKKKAKKKAKKPVEATESNALLPGGASSDKAKAKKRSASAPPTEANGKGEKSAVLGRDVADLGLDGFNDLSGRDQAVRQIALLQEEVTALTGQVENLNGDNKKWRQLIGKDALTGLPNGLALLRIYLSKVVRGLAESGPHSCIAIGLDHVGKMNLQHGWQMGNLILLESVKGLRKLMRDGEELFRLGGVNFVIAGMMDANAARQRASEIRRVLGAATVKVEETVMPLSSSLGVVTVERRSSDSDMQAAAKLHRALINTLYRAKDKGGNNWDVHNITNF